MSTPPISPVSLKPLRQVTAELLACAVCDLFPRTLLVEKKITDIGFHYDFILPNPIDQHSLPLIEERMRFLINQDNPIESLEMMRTNAIDYFMHQNQHILCDQLADSSAQFVSLFKMGDFLDLSSLDAYKNTSEIKCAFKLQNFQEHTLSLSEKDTLPLTRIEGTVFPDSYQLKKFLKRVEAARKRDHVLLGEQMNLYNTHDGLCGGTWFWQPRGTYLRNVLKDLWNQEHREQHIELIQSPPFIPSDFLKERQYRRSTKVTAAFFPEMTAGEISCNFRPSLTPLHALTFQALKPTERQMPIRYGECAQFFEQEDEDTLAGLFKTRVYEADRVSLFCTPEQFFEEFISSLHFIEKIIKMFGFEHHWTFVHRIQGRVPYFEKWDASVKEMERGLELCGIEYQKDPTTTHPYGPCVHVCITDALGREWKGPFLGIDFYHVEQLKLRYSKEGTQNQEPVLLVRSLFGSIERFLALLVEHFGGEFPLWLSPEHVRIIPLSMKNIPYAELIDQRIKEMGFRSQIDNRLDNLGEKVHIAEREKVPYIIIIGEKEEKDNSVTIRSSHKGTLKTQDLKDNDRMKLDLFLTHLQEKANGLLVSLNKKSTNENNQ